MKNSLQRLALAAMLLCTAATAMAGKAKKCLFLFESASAWTQEDSIVKVSYNLQYGDNTAGYGYDVRYPYVVVKVRNKTMQTVYIDLGRTFLVKGEESAAYYVPGETQTTTGSSRGATVNMGSVAGALGVGGAVGTLASGVNVGGGSSSSTTNVTYTQRVVAVPPMSTTTLERKPLIAYTRGANNHIFVKDFGGLVKVGNVNTVKNPNLYLYMDCPATASGENLQPGQHLEYTAESSPIALNTYLSYSLTESCETVTTLAHSCHVAQIWGLKSNKAQKEMPAYFPGYTQYKSILVSCTKSIM